MQSVTTICMGLQINKEDYIEHKQLFLLILCKHEN